MLLIGSLLISASFLLVSCSSTQSDDPLLSNVRFRYESPFKGQVQLVWGVDRWQILKWQFVDGDYRPQGTYIKDDLMYTPMTRQGDVYTVNVSLPEGTKLRYGFELFEDGHVDVSGYWDGDAAGILVLEEPDQEINMRSTIADI